ncbi:MAG: 30S ribosomal protein S8 [Cyanobacteria bacterium J06641_5]
MAANDAISDMLTRIRNACMVHHETTAIPSTKLLRNIARVLKQEGFIEDYREETLENSRKQLVVSLKYKGKFKEPIIRKLIRVSKPGLRVYSNHKDMPRVLGGIGVAIVSTSSGIMTDREARSKGIGGEVLCYVW